VGLGEGFLPEGTRSALCAAIRPLEPEQQHLIALRRGGRNSQPRWRSGTPLRLSYFGVITLAK
jgi:hypothetical protein